ncbi:GNAT family N-acetyltransferase [Latilactobacillus graminis]|uniref:GNAT family acetyltraansferase n=2 Tax=Latilactobacillus graminis TaxID=60519 RepID=A0AA89L483_9LACO|nr:GNAT family N-acetyltransferase [Latilactobacillus graminis]KRM23285.1 GNAT family acetyltraansferase [Latilactobacillus graminis DSM 20719]QFP78954.1 GNAT family N-acetyltransferase [Latilactobacillus graminis]
MVEKRKLMKTDEQAFYALAQYAFNKVDSVQRQHFFKQLYTHSTGFGVFEDNRLVSGLLATPFDVRLNGQTFKMSGIGYVASYPEFAGKGSIASLMQLAFEDMQTTGITLSYLAPFAYGFYRRFGYEQVFEQTIFEIQTADLPRLKFAPSVGRVVRMSLAQAIPLISAFFNHHPNNQAGGIQRADWWWQYDAMKHSDWEVAVDLDGKKAVAGYLIYSRQVGTFVIQELMTSTVASQTQLINFILKHQSAYATIQYESALTESLADLLPNPTIVKTTTVPYMMARIVSLPDFLAQYAYQVQELPVTTIAIQDDFLPANAGLWQLSIHAGQATVIKLATGTADITVTIQNLTKAMLGYRSLESQAHYGHVQGAQPKIAQLSAAFSHTKPMLWDYF